MRNVYLIKLDKNDHIAGDSKYFKIPFTNYYLIKGCPVIYFDDAGRHFEPYEINCGIVNTVKSWW